MRASIAIFWMSLNDELLLVLLFLEFIILEAYKVLVIFLLLDVFDLISELMIIQIELCYIRYIVVLVDF